MIDDDHDDHKARFLVVQDIAVLQTYLRLTPVQLLTFTELERLTLALARSVAELELCVAGNSNMSDHLNDLAVTIKHEASSASSARATQGDRARRISQIQTLLTSTIMDLRAYFHIIDLWGSQW